MAHLLCGVEHRIVHIYIENHRAITHLLARNGERLVVVALVNQAQEFAAARHITSLAHIYKTAVWREAIQARQPRNLPLGRDAWRSIFYRFGNGCDMARRRAAATAHYVHQTEFCKVRDVACHNLWRLVILPHLVGDARIGVGADVAGCYVCHLLQKWQHLLRSKRAV